MAAAAAAGRGFGCYMSPERVEAQGEWQQQFKAGSASLGFGERQQLGIVIDRGVVGTNCVDDAFHHPFTQCIEVALAAQWRTQVAIGVEETDVVFGQVQMVGGNVAGDRQSLRLGLADHFDAFAGR